MLKYNFPTQKRLGDLAESMVENALNKNFEIKKESSLHYQKKGIDFDLILPQSCGKYTIEVKLDTYSETNGRFFLEFLQTKRLGWVYTCTSDLLFLCQGLRGKIKITNPTVLRQNMNAWMSKYPIKTCHNVGGKWAKGVTTPIYTIPGVFVDINKSVISIENIYKALNN